MGWASFWAIILQTYPVTLPRNSVIEKSHGKYEKVIFWSMPLFLFFRTQTRHIKTVIHYSIAMFSPKNLITWQESNPGLQLLRRMRCPLRHAARAAYTYLGRVLTMPMSISMTELHSIRGFFITPRKKPLKLVAVWDKYHA
jgi:hypothetical protein